MDLSISLRIEFSRRFYGSVKKLECLWCSLSFLTVDPPDYIEGGPLVGIGGQGVPQHSDSHCWVF